MQIAVLSIFLLVPVPEVISTGKDKDCSKETVCIPEDISSVPFHKELRCYIVTDYPGLTPSLYYTNFISPCDIAKHQCWFDNKLTIKGPVPIWLCPDKEERIELGIDREEREKRLEIIAKAEELETEKQNVQEEEKHCSEEKVCAPNGIPSTNWSENESCYTVKDYPGMADMTHFTKFSSQCDVAKHQCWYDNKLNHKLKTP